MKILLILIIFCSLNVFICNCFYQVLYYSRHDGTIADFEYFASIYPKINVTIDVSARLIPFGQTFAVAQKNLIDFHDKYIHWIEYYDAIIVADTIPDGLSLLLLLDQSPHLFNRTKIIFHVTNRYNYAISEAKYYEYMIYINKYPQIFWLINNPWEEIYVTANGINATTTLVRPFGVSDCPIQNLAPEKQEKCAMYSNTFFHQFGNELNLEVIHGRYYGG